MMDYCAHMVQRPGELSRVAILFKSNQGVGKNVFWENFINSILGREYLLQTADIDKIVGRFSMVQNKLCIIMDETSGKDSFLNSEKIKNSITAETIAWERKGIAGVTLNNCARLLFFTNNSTPIKIEMTDRRFVVYECADDVKNNEAYFKDLISNFKNKQHMKTLFGMLMARDISKWNSVADRPITQIYRDIQSAGIPPMALYLDSMVKDYRGASPENPLNMEALMRLPLAVDMFQNFTTWLRENGFTKLEYNTTKFGRELKTYKGIEKKRTNSAYKYAIDFDELEKNLADYNI